MTAENNWEEHSAHFREARLWGGEKDGGNMTTAFVKVKQMKINSNHTTFRASSWRGYGVMI